MKTKSWVWQYAQRQGEKAKCFLCNSDRNNSFSCRGGTTGSLSRHLQRVHGITEQKKTATPANNTIIGDDNDRTSSFDTISEQYLGEVDEISIEETKPFASFDNAAMGDDYLGSHVKTELHLEESHENSLESIKLHGSPDNIKISDESRRNKTKAKSWVWQHGHREGEICVCYLCGDTFSCRGGSTGSLGRHLQALHGISAPTENKTSTSTENATTNNGYLGSNDKMNLSADPGKSEEHSEETLDISTEGAKPYNSADITKISDESRRNNMKNKSWVWQHGHRVGEIGICYLCSDTFSCRGGSTGSLGRHLQAVHGISASNENTSSTSTDNTTSIQEENTEEYNKSSLWGLEPSSKKRKIHKRRLRNAVINSISTEDRQEEIHQALTKMIALNQMPLAFCSSKGFIEFMAVVEPTYKPVEEGVIRQRLESLRHGIEYVIRDNIDKASGVSCTSESWSSSPQDSYITTTAHVIDKNWIPRSFTLETNQADERSIADITEDWGLSGRVMAVVTDKVADNVKIESPEQIQEDTNLTCAAQSVHLAVIKAISSEYIQGLIHKASKTARHFINSHAAKHALQEKQKQLGFQVQSLLRHSHTRWNSISVMLQRLIKNRVPITKVLAEHTSTHLELSEQEWISLEELANVLEPVHLLSNLLCADDSPASMVRPLMYELLENHMVLSETDSTMVAEFKSKFTNDLRERLNLQRECTSNIISTRQVASLLDPRYKYLEHEDYNTRTAIREKLKQLLTENAPIESATTANNSNSSTQCSSEKKSALEFLYKQTSTNRNNVDSQLDAYFSEPQLKFDLNPYEWWQCREDKYPAIAQLARNYLCIPATSVSSERSFTATAESAGTLKRESISPEDVDLLVFLYQNRKIFPSKDAPDSVQ